MICLFWFTYAIIASTGHTSHPVRPNSMSAPAPNWSHFDFFKCILTMEAIELLRLPHDKWVVVVYSASFPTSSSPRRKKQKNATVATAQNAWLLGSGALSITPLICLSTAIVIGRRMRGVLGPCATLVLRIPSSTLFSTGCVDSSRGGGSPRDSAGVEAPGTVACSE